jgi:hypothetical protein
MEKSKVLHSPVIHIVVPPPTEATLMVPHNLHNEINIKRWPTTTHASRLLVDRSFAGYTNSLRSLTEAHDYDTLTSTSHRARISDSNVETGLWITDRVESRNWADKLTGTTDVFGNSAVAWAGTHASSRYRFLKGGIAKNISGNHRGVVQSALWHARFRIWAD